MDEGFRDWVVLIVGPYRYMGKPVNESTVKDLKGAVLSAIAGGMPIPLNPCIELYVATTPLMHQGPGGPQMRGVMRSPFPLAVDILFDNQNIHLVANAAYFFSDMSEKDYKNYSAMIEEVMKKKREVERTEANQRLLEPNA